MTGQQAPPEDARKSLEAGRAAGYCWLGNPAGAGRCTRPPHHSGRHLDSYNGRHSPADTSGNSWS
ncbi:hypothetical protein [Streptomyces graminilatus]|uniref:hypothetical protein n=1 Tax=Streptomyces graminilatus TaxID=1464070 RepID=UPI0006E3B6A4|nr:hypothetical protein [Streptomyces graminilatus]